MSPEFGTLHLAYQRSTYSGKEGMQTIWGRLSMSRSGERYVSSDSHLCGSTGGRRVLANVDRPSSDPPTNEDIARQVTQNVASGDRLGRAIARVPVTQAQNELMLTLWVVSDDVGAEAVASAAELAKRGRPTDRPTVAIVSLVQHLPKMLILLAVFSAGVGGFSLLVRGMSLLPRFREKRADLTGDVKNCSGGNGASSADIVISDSSGQRAGRALPLGARLSLPPPTPPLVESRL